MKPEQDPESTAFEINFRAKVREKFTIGKMLEVAAGGLECMLIKTHVSKHEMVESEPYPDWSGRLAWWKAIAQAGGMISDEVEKGGPGSIDNLIQMAAQAARARMQE